MYVFFQAAKMKATIVENPQTMNLKHALLASHQLRASIEKYRIQKDVHAAITQIMVSTPPSVCSAAQGKLGVSRTSTGCAA